jgi:hypothetical protein
MSSKCSKNWEFHLSRKGSWRIWDLRLLKSKPWRFVFRVDRKEACVPYFVGTL